MPHLTAHAFLLAAALLAALQPCTSLRTPMPPPDALAATPPLATAPMLARRLPNEQEIAGLESRHVATRAQPPRRPQHTRLAAVASPAARSLSCAPCSTPKQAELHLLRQVAHQTGADPSLLRGTQQRQVGAPHFQLAGFRLSGCACTSAKGGNEGWDRQDTQGGEEAFGLLWCLACCAPVAPWSPLQWRRPSLASAASLHAWSAAAAAARSTLREPDCRHTAGLHALAAACTSCHCSNHHCTPALHRLTWIGDAMLGAAVSELLYRALPSAATTEVGIRCVMCCMCCLSV